MVEDASFDNENPQLEGPSLSWLLYTSSSSNSIENDLKVRTCLYIFNSKKKTNMLCMFIPAKSIRTTGFHNKYLVLGSSFIIHV